MKKFRTRSFRQYRKMGILIFLTVVVAVSIVAIKNPQLFQPKASDGSSFPQNGTVSLVFNPATMVIDTNKDQVIDLRMNTSTSKVAILEAVIEYDPAAIDMKSISKGSFLSGTPLAEPKISNGKATFTFIAPNNSTVQGNGSVATMILRNKIIGQPTSITVSTRTAAFGTNAFDEIINQNIMKSAGKITFTAN